MKETNYDALHCVPFTSYYYLLSIMSKQFSAYALFTKTHNINNPLKFWIWNTHAALKGGGLYFQKMQRADEYYCKIWKFVLY